MNRYAIVISGGGVFFEDANSQNEAVAQLEGKHAGITAGLLDVFQYSPEGIAPADFANRMIKEVNAQVFANQRNFTDAEKEAARITMGGNLVSGFQVKPDGSVTLITDIFS